MLSIFIKKISMFFSLEKKEFISQRLLQTPDFVSLNSLLI